jgi:hypothetical protein
VFITDEQGRRLFAVKLSPEMQKYVEACTTLEKFERAVNDEFWRRHAEKLDRDILGS